MDSEGDVRRALRVYRALSEAKGNRLSVNTTQAEKKISYLASGAIHIYVKRTAIAHLQIEIVHHSILSCHLLESGEPCTRICLGSPCTHICRYIFDSNRCIKPPTIFAIYGLARLAIGTHESDDKATFLNHILVTQVRISAGKMGLCPVQSTLSIGHYGQAEENEIEHSAFHAAKLQTENV